MERFGHRPRGSYRQIFDPAQRDLDTPGNREALLQLANDMLKNPGGNSGRLEPGYTYFGQFIDHDLTWNQAKISDDRNGQVNAQNFRTARLDLDSVYGDGPPGFGQYEGKPDEETLRIGPTVDSEQFGLEGGALRDIPLDGLRPLIADGRDIRNAENLIVRQLHVVFLKFHNRLIRELPEHANDSDVPQSGTLFSRARRLAQWTYQYLVWNDFLHTLWTTGTYRKPRKSNVEFPKPTYRLPLEFVLAGFRFGHSMVRESYPLNCHHPFDRPVPILNLINRHEDTVDRLPADLVVEWGVFFSGDLKRSTRLLPARQIDTAITDALSMLPPEAVRLFSITSDDQEPLNLPYRTLLRGARARIGSGQEVANRLRADGVHVSDIQAILGNDPFLRSAGLTEDTPLWYYILKEAEKRENGDALGTLGTWLVSTTIEEVLQHDHHSYINEKSESWEPPPWIFSDNEPSLVELIRFAGLDEFATGCVAIPNAQPEASS